ncbi:hypothetical protein [Ornithinicoccus halotolerans]|uniref:hypothetical protein n=1 Tax=Ornithinicoccus halotolerans TaxID=1748220 RepID=UPI001295F777|nr:hypothetical protein [Ornithinicoccus halotolerans]
MKLNEKLIAPLTNQGEAAKAVRATRTNPVLAEAVRAIPAYVKAQTAYDHLVAQLAAIPDPPVEASLAADLHATITAGKPLPADLVETVAARQAQGQAYVHTQTLLSHLAAQLLQQRDATVTANTDTALTHLQDVVTETIAELTDIIAVPDDALTAAEAGHSEQWKRRHELLTTYRHARQAQWLLCQAATKGGTGLSDQAQHTWTHAAYIPDAERHWEDPDDFAHYLARGWKPDPHGDRITLTPPYPDRPDHDAWGRWLATTQITPWVPSLDQLQARVARLANLASAVTTNKATPARISARTA